MRGVVFFALCVICSGSNLVAQQLSPAEIANVLAQVRQKRAAAPQVQADFKEEKMMRLMNKPIVSVGHVWIEPPNKFRREVRGNSPSTAVSDGRELWIYYPNFKTAERYQLGKHSPVDAAIAAINTALNLQNVENSFQITGAKHGDGYTLQLTPRTAAMKRTFERFTLELNSELHVSRTEMVQPNGDRVVTVYSNQSRAAIPAAMFEFKPPAGTEVTAPLGR
jgi:chaperone LolA